MTTHKGRKTAYSRIMRPMLSISYRWYPFKCKYHPISNPRLSSFRIIIWFRSTHPRMMPDSQKDDKGQRRRLLFAAETSNARTVSLSNARMVPFRVHNWFWFGALTWAKEAPAVLGRDRLRAIPSSPSSLPQGSCRDYPPLQLPHHCRLGQVCDHTSAQ